jgi:hypothetical protein
MEVFPAPRKPVKTVIGMVEGASELEGMIKCKCSAGRGNRNRDGGASHVPRFVDRQLASHSIYNPSSQVGWSIMPSTILLTIRASRLARLHTFLSLTAFIGALAIGSSLHYTKIVKNAVAGWPEEWFPSVSAT